MGAYYSACRFLATAFIATISKREVRGRANVPREGGLIVASNHVSFWDPPMVGGVVPREAYYLAKEELFSSPVLGPLLRSVHSIPIRRGSADLSGLSRAIEVLKRGGALVLFPEGSRMRDGELHPARPGLGLLAVQSDAAIVPCHISGSGEPRRWMFRRAPIRIWFGTARHWRDYAGAGQELPPGRALYQRIGEAVMQDIAALRSEQLSASRGAA